MTWLGATEDFLNRIGRPAQIKPLASYLVGNDWVESRARDFRVILRSSVRRDIRDRAAKGDEQSFYMTAGIVGLTSYESDRFAIDLRETYVSFERESGSQLLPRPMVTIGAMRQGFRRDCHLRRLAASTPALRASRTPSKSL